MSTKVKSENRRMVSRLLVVTLAMFGFGFAMVPLYDVFCEVTGIRLVDAGRIDAEAAGAVEPDLSREVTVIFLGNIGGEAPLEFHPEVTKMTVHPGKSYRANYLASNLAERPLTAQAVPSVAPPSANKHFNKTECFCFTSQAFEAGETKEMPLTFIVSRDLPRTVDTVTLSYTFFDTTRTSGG
jgi:cytochrome c oxidase assembly protein subunit 11